MPAGVDGQRSEHARGDHDRPNIAEVIEWKIGHEVADKEKRGEASRDQGIERAVVGHVLCSHEDRMRDDEYEE